MIVETNKQRRTPVIIRRSLFYYDLLSLFHSYVSICLIIVLKKQTRHLATIHHRQTLWCRHCLPSFFVFLVFAKSSFLLVLTLFIRLSKSFSISCATKTAFLAACRDCGRALTIYGALNFSRPRLECPALIQCVSASNKRGVSDVMELILCRSGSSLSHCSFYFFSSWRLQCGMSVWVVKRWWWWCRCCVLLLIFSGDSSECIAHIW